MCLSPDISRQVEDHREADRHHLSDRRNSESQTSISPFQKLCRT
jgi:hypothetical protein